MSYSVFPANLPDLPSPPASVLASSLPAIIQGGMGIGISGWRLARAVSLSGGLGVVSATGLDTVFARHLQDGDEGGHLRRAMASFPVPEVTVHAMKRYFRAGGRPAGAPYRAVPMFQGPGRTEAQALTILSCYCEVFLAREGHAGPVGINLLTKLQSQTLPSLYGAMLAGVDAVLMGAGIPREIAVVLGHFARGEAASLRLDVTGDPVGAPTFLSLDPAVYKLAGRTLKRPAFLPIISSNLLASLLVRLPNHGVSGFVVEGPSAGGHNAPPRGPTRLDESGQPVYGPRDEVDLSALRTIGLPFWLAGGTGHPGALQAAQAQGAAGIQVGTLFAYCDESGLDEALKARVLAQAEAGGPAVRTDPHASPTGFPFKVVELTDTLADPELMQARIRVCDLGYLRETYRSGTGQLGFRCPAEPVTQYLAKGGQPEATTGRQCLCNALLADIGLGQRRGDHTELPLLTSGDGLSNVRHMLQGRDHYSAADTLAYLQTGEVPPFSGSDRPTGVSPGSRPS